MEPTYEVVLESHGPLYGRNREYRNAFSGNIRLFTDKDRQALAEFHKLNLENFYEFTQSGAPEDCGDERPATTLVDAMLKPVGPQNMGGTSTHALVWGMTTGRTESHLRSLSALNVEYVQNRVKYRPGGHEAQGAHGMNCGCAAIDMIPDVNNVILDPDRRDAHIYLTSLFTGLDKFDEDAYDRNLYRYDELNRRIGSYLPSGYQHASLDLMRKLSPDIEPINQRVGEHNGLAVVVNRIHHTRLSQDLLFATPNSARRPFEAFGIDVWYAPALGYKLFPTDEIARQDFITGRLMYDTGALLAITDGSPELLERKAS